MGTLEYTCLSTSYRTTFSLIDSFVHGGISALEQALDPFLQLNMERPRKRHDHHLAVVQFIPLAGFGAFRQP
jgi:hypothetical protein